MPAKNVCQRNAQRQRRNGAPMFTKRKRFPSPASDTGSKYEDSSDLGTDETDKSDFDHDDDTESQRSTIRLQNFFDVFRDPTERGDVERRISEVSMLMPYIEGFSVDGAILQAKFDGRAPYTSKSSVTKRRKDKGKKDLEEAAKTCDSAAFEAFERKPGVSETILASVKVLRSPPISR